MLLLSRTLAYLLPQTKLMNQIVTTQLFKQFTSSLFCLNNCLLHFSIDSSKMWLKYFLFLSKYAS